jgi:hypothetical protein
MRAFVVYLNGRRLCTAGVGDQGVLTVNVTWVRREGPRTLSKRSDSVEEELGLEVGGLITSSDEHVRWRQRPIGVGDEVRIEVVESKSVDRPRHRERRDRTKELQQQKAYVQRMATRFGWKIQKP